MDLYKFNFLGTTYTYTSGADEVTFSGIDYKPSPIKRTEIALEINDSDVRVTLPLDIPFLKKIVMSSPSQDINLTIYNFEAGIEIFSGILKNIVFKAKLGVAEAKFQRKESFFESMVPYRTFGSSCSLGLYSNECGVDKLLHSITIENFILSEDKRSLSTNDLVSYPNNTFTGGMLSTNFGEYFYILNQTTNTIFLDQPIIEPPFIITIEKGCNKTLTTCTNVFNNNLNFGGFPLIPEKNPVTGSI